MILTYHPIPLMLVPDEPADCDLCGQPIPVIDGTLAACFAHEPDCPDRDSDDPGCGCDLTLHPGCCPDCAEDYQ